MSLVERLKMPSRLSDFLVGSLEWCVVIGIRVSREGGPRNEQCETYVPPRLSESSPRFSLSLLFLTPGCAGESWLSYGKRAFTNDYSVLMGALFEMKKGEKQKRFVDASLLVVEVFGTEVAVRVWRCSFC